MTLYLLDFVISGLLILYFFKVFSIEVFSNPKSTAYSSDKGLLISSTIFFFSCFLIP